MEELISVQCRFKQSTCEKVERLRKKLKLENKADTVRMSIDIAYLVTKALSEGKKVLIEPPCWQFWKNRQKIVVPSIKMTPS